MKDKDDKFLGLKQEKLGRVKWTNERIQAEADKYDTKKSFSKNNPTAYASALRRGIDTFCKHMTKNWEGWKDDDIQKEADKYTTRGEFCGGNTAAYTAALRRGIDKFCAHMDPAKTKWSDHVVIQGEADKYNTKQEFNKGNRGAYRAASRIGIDKFCGHMSSNRSKIDRISIQDEALKFCTRNDFNKGNKKLYNAARRLGVLDTVCRHMIEVRVKWEDHLIQKEADKYNTRKEFEISSNNAYNAAIRRGIDKFCEHMKNGHRGFKQTEKAVLYCIKLEAENGVPVYKIGVSNNADIKQRIRTLKVSKSFKATVVSIIPFRTGKAAYKIEQYLLKEYKAYLYNGEHILGSGNTELFIKDVITPHFTARV